MGGRGYTWSKVTTCRTLRREKLITRMAGYAQIALTKYGKACTVENRRDERGLI